LLSALRPALPNATGAPQAVLEELSGQINVTQQGFIHSMDEDFNTAGALSQIFDLVRAINQARSEQATDEELAPAQNLFKELTNVLGLELKSPELSSTGSDAFVDLLIALRKELREQKLYALSDHVRDELAKLGVIIEDTPQGTAWRWE